MTSGLSMDALVQRIEREIDHVTGVRQRLLGNTVTPSTQWVIDNAEDPLFIDRLNSFGVQLGGTAESVSKLLLPRLLSRAAENTGSVVDNLAMCNKWLEHERPQPAAPTGGSRPISAIHQNGLFGYLA